VRKQYNVLSRYTYVLQLCSKVSVHYYTYLVKGFHFQMHYNQFLSIED